MALQTILLALTVLCAAAQTPPCRILGRAAKPSFYQHGDIIIGGVFALNQTPLEITMKFDIKPEPQKCSGILGRATKPSFYQHGDINIGGVFSLRQMPLEITMKFNIKPESQKCSR
ncbi:hypothetical protein SKAU_G00078140 [Synaphobranchus kaupii]|uniref:Uncharacterized protein n=1 Tax=Synaphobranchus kaupii TaxID=118154 RepID=A0A9Q1J579_SYNKA|nr:hypothetical protein SKAU_G00078140 [Synaphobranchus kaupii]